MRITKLVGWGTSPETQYSRNSGAIQGLDAVGDEHGKRLVSSERLLMALAEA
jgi:hypothetical protein